MLLNYESDGLLKVIKLGFAMSVVVDTLMIYPCRQSSSPFLAGSKKYQSLTDDATYIAPSGIFLFLKVFNFFFF